MAGQLAYYSPSKPVQKRKEAAMDFIERWLNISPDGGNGTLEFLIVTAIILAIITVVAVALRGSFLAKLSEYLEQLGRRGYWDRFNH